MSIIYMGAAVAEWSSERISMNTNWNILSSILFIKSPQIILPDIDKITLIYCRGASTFSITTFITTTLSNLPLIFVTLIAVTLSLMILSLTTKIVTFSIKTLIITLDVWWCYAMCRYAEYRYAIKSNMQSVVLLNVILLNVEAPLHTFLICPFILFNLKELLTYLKSN
jgi:hypothetical protein